MKILITHLIAVTLSLMPSLTQAAGDKDFIVFFQTNSATIDSNGRDTLNSFVGFYTSHQLLCVSVMGHTDAAGSDRYNLRLSEQRVKAVATYIGDKGVPSNQIRLGWKGEQTPIVRAIAEEPFNRRVTLAPIDDPVACPGSKASTGPVVIYDYRDFFAYFAHDSATLDTDARDELDQYAEFHKGCQFIGILLTAHADTSGPSRYNLKLSQRRAQAVKNYLTTKGIAAETIRMKWEGERHPALTTQGEVREPLNRRVSIEWIGDCQEADAP
ncbi:OmpA family protein [Asticcacaulis sp. YBE204]|uniref:OmpA family protein n=1 Tax=Asticcacaulis sp. YBE204 TaxID=1282363 RepID=UPI0004CF5BF4|nr:OmpA family protein [Asticcacaulis sp. YBE204]